VQSCILPTPRRPYTELMFVRVHRSRLWLLLGAFAFLGLFAMHGLGGHGANHASVGGSHHGDRALQASANPMTASNSAHQEPRTSQGCDGTCVGDDTTVAGTGSGSSGGHSLAMALCLVVLAAAAAATIAALGRRLRPALLEPPGLLDRAALVLRSAVGHDPPSIFALSVQLS
jgi:hypothetical protein